MTFRVFMWAFTAALAVAGALELADLFGLLP